MLCDPPHVASSTYGLNGWAVAMFLKTSVRLCFFLSFYIHFSHSLSDLWYLFLGTLASLTWSGIGCSSFWKTPTSLPSVCGSGRMGIPDIWSHQFKGTPLHFHCAVEIQIAYICFLEQYLFQWQMNKCNLTLFIINDIGVYSSKFD